MKKKFKSEGDVGLALNLIRGNKKAHSKLVRRLVGIFRMK